MKHTKESNEKTAQRHSQCNKKHREGKRPLMQTLALGLAMCTGLLGLKHAQAHGFNANHVDIVKTFGRKYRVIIKYTHVELGEYREAHIDFDKKDDAIKAFQDLAKGADFFLGDVKNSIHFHNPPETSAPL
ncbi:MAG: hypothetical protein RLZZ488_1381 [Pseudomonadota bacterium]|jgi:hypothetical protein